VGNKKLKKMKSTFKTFTTISNYEIKVRENNSKKHFTIITSGGKYKTLPMNKEEFNSCLNNTANDWKQFLKSNDYYKI
jgi:hypothetical protein